MKLPQEPDPWPVPPQGDHADNMISRNYRRAHIEKRTGQWRNTEHWKVLLENIAHMRENIRSHVHPYLILFAGDTNWITTRQTAGLLTIHRRARASGFKGVVHRSPATKAIIRLHQRILDCWDADMA